MHFVNHGIALIKQTSWLGSRYIQISLLPPSEMKSATAKNMSVLFLISALIFGVSRAIAELRLASRTTIVLSRAAVSKKFVSAVVVPTCTAAYP